MLLHKRSMYNNRPEPNNYIYGCYRTTTDFIKRFVNQTILNTLKIIDNLVCKIILSFNFLLLKFTSTKINRVS